MQKMPIIFVVNLNKLFDKELLLINNVLISTTQSQKFFELGITIIFRYLI